MPAIAGLIAKMGLGDNLMATGMARGANARRKRIAFGDGSKIIWDKNSKVIFQNNPNIAPPGSEAAWDLEWIGYHKGSRIYNRQDGNRWVWNYDFKPQPGEMFFLSAERRFGESFGKGFVIIEPNVPAHKSVAPNKQWPKERYDRVAAELIAQGYHVRQFIHGPGHRVSEAQQIRTHSFRMALSVLSNAALYIGPEGGLHHGAAAVGIPAVVLFGGFIPPQVTGYDGHVNLTGGAEACGNFTPCQHCTEAMARIECEEVIAPALGFLQKAAA